MPDRQRFDVYPDLDSLSAAAAEYVAATAAAAIVARGRFVVALAGGSTPRRLYQLLASDAWRDRIDWGRWHVFLGDERVVPPTDPNSNYLMAEQALLSQVPIPASQVHRVPTELGEPAAVAAAYERQVREVAGSGDGGVPRFDLVLLGIGSDGHTASLFPGKPALDETARLVVASPPGVLPPPVDRVTFTFPLLDAARAVAFLAGGADKVAAIRAARDRTTLGDVAVVPAARVQPTAGELRWFVDAAAAGEAG